MNLIGIWIIALFVVVAVEAGHERQDKDIFTDPCYDNVRRVCMTCQSKYRFSNAEECHRGGRREVCGVGPQSICWEQLGANGVYEAGCKQPDECVPGVVNGTETKCSEGIVKPCGFDNWQSVTQFHYCENEYTVCEWKKMKFPWTCPEGQELRVEAFWGRMPGDNITCIEGVPGQNPVDSNCPGDPERVREGINYQCKKLSKGQCYIKARIGKLRNYNAASGKWKKYDPCPYTFKYLKICSKCVPIAANRPVLMLLDVSGSLMSMDVSYLPKATQFLQTFFDFTSTAAFFADHKTNMFVVPFDRGVRQNEEWSLDYSTFSNAADLVADEKNDMAGFLNLIEAKQPTSLTNIGKSLDDAFQQYMPDENWVVVVVSDFINMIFDPSIESSLQLYRDAGVHVYPVLLDKPIRNETTYQFVKSQSLDAHGIDTRNGVSAADVHAFY